MAQEIGERCFLKIIIGVFQKSESSELFSGTELEGLVSTLQLLESIYSDIIWQNLALVVLGQGLSSSKLLTFTILKLVIIQPTFLPS